MCIRDRYRIVLGNNDVDKQSEVKYIHITKPVDKLVVNNNKDNSNNPEQLTSTQRNKLNQLIKRRQETHSADKNEIQILTIKYALPN